MSQLQVTVVRHAETNANLNHIFQGHIDTKINKTGKEQLTLVSRRLRKMKFDHIYSSDLRRAKETADAIAKNHPETPITTDMRIRERDFGRLNGLSVYQALDLVKEEGTSWSDYGEPEEDYKAQVVDFFDDIIYKHLPGSEGYREQSLTTDSGAKRNPHILIVTHGGTISKLVKEHLIMDLGFHVNDYLSMKHKAKNTSVTKFVVRKVYKPTTYAISNAVENKSNDGNDDNGSEKAFSTRQKIRIEGEITLWNCVSHLASQGKRTHGDSQIDDLVH